MNAKKITQKAGNIGLSLIVLIAILLGSVPDLTVRVEAATPIISNPEIINLPLSSTGGTSYHRIYEMYNTNTGMPVYCTLKGQALPQSGFALQPETIENNPTLFYRLNYIYESYPLSTPYTTWAPDVPSTDWTTYNTWGFPYSQMFGTLSNFNYIVNQLAVWMVIDRCESAGIVSDPSNLLYGGGIAFNTYTEYNETQYADAKAATLALSIPISAKVDQISTYLGFLANSRILTAAYDRADAAMAQTQSYTIPSLVCDASLVNKSEWTYLPASGVYAAVVQANVTNGGTWVIDTAVNCSPDRTSGVNGEWITVYATYDQTQADPAPNIRIRAVPPAGSTTQRYFSLFTSNGQTFVTPETWSWQEGTAAAAAWAPTSTRLYKVDATAGGTPLAGATYNIYNQDWSYAYNMAGDQLSSLVTDAQGIIDLGRLANGLYFYLETAAPAEYNLDPDPHAFTVWDYRITSGDMTATDFRMLGVDITKLEAGTGAAIQGAVIGIYTDAACTSLYRSGTTGPGGIYDAGQMPDGTWYYREITPATGYRLNTTIYSFTVYQGELSGASTTTLYNLKVWVDLYKRDSVSNAALSGATIGVYSDAACTTLIAQGVTNASGIFHLESLADGVYYYRELSPPAGYNLNPNIYNFTVSNGFVSGTTTIYDVPYPDVTITKRDAATAVPVPGAVFGFYTDSACTILYTQGTTDANGHVVLTNVPDGQYWWRELVAPEGYYLDPTIYSFIVSGGVVSGTTTMYDNQLPDVTITKTGSDTGSGVAGAVITVYRNSGLTDVYYTGTTDSNGQITMSAVSDGTYYYRETTAPSGYALNDTVYSFIVSSGSVTGTLTFQNIRIIDVTLRKLDATTLAGVPGVTFEVYTDEALTSLFYTGTTNSEGILTVPSVPAGTYWWRETSVPVEYNPNPIVQTFVVAGGAVVDGSLSIQNYPRPDLTLSKTDTNGDPVPGTQFTVFTDADGTVEYATGVTNDQGNFTTNNVPDGVYYWRETQASPGFIPDGTMHAIEVVNGMITGEQAMSNEETIVLLWKQDATTGNDLEGAVYEIRDASNTVVATGTTREDGSMEFRRLPIGSYSFSEIQAPYGYLIDTTVRTFTIAADGSVTGDWYVANTRQQYRIQIVKEKESGVWNSVTGQYDFPIVPAEGIIFSVYAAENIYDAVGNLIWALDTRVEMIQTDANGVATTTSDLYPGAYYAVETAATPDVVLDDQTRYPLSVVPPDQVTPLITIEANNGEAIQNRAIAGTLEIHKITGDTGVPMIGVVFEVYDLNGEMVDNITTDANGNAKTKVLPYGQYTLVETKTWSGYVLSENQHFVIYEAPAEGEIISEAEMILENQRMAKVEVYKVTEVTQIPMNGVVFGIYSEQTNEEIARITTDATGYGYAEFAGGSYYMRELVTWEGYAVNDGQIPFNAEGATVYTFRETNDTTITKFFKEGTDGTRLPNMYFTVKKANPGIPLEFVYSAEQNAYIYVGVLSEEERIGATTTPRTMENGETTILGLPAGEYLATEVQAPPGYVLDQKPVAFSVQEGNTATNNVLLVDAAITVKTGQSGETFQRMVSYGIILTAISATMILINEIRRIRRRDESEEKQDE